MMMMISDLISATVRLPSYDDDDDIGLDFLPMMMMMISDLISSTVRLLSWRNAHHMLMMILDLISATVVDCFVMWFVIVSAIYHCGRVGGYCWSILLVKFLSSSVLLLIIVSLYH
jgi:hypothetical protein